MAARVYDHVDTSVPAAALRPTFVYRHRQLFRRSGRTPRRRRGGRAADGRRGHRRLGPGRLRSVGVPDHGRASRDSARAPSGAQWTERQWNPTPPRPTCCPESTPSCTWRARRSPDASPMVTRPRSATAASSRRAGSPTAAALADDGPPRFVSASAIGYLRLRPRRRAAVRRKRARRRFPGRRGGRLGGRDGAGRRGGAAGGHRAHRNRAGGARWHAEAAAAAVRWPGWAAGWAAASSGCRGSASTTCSTSITAPLYDDSADRSRQRGRAGTGAQRRLHQGAGGCAAPSGGGAGAVVRVRGCCWGSRAHASSPRPISGWCRPS